MMDVLFTIIFLAILGGCAYALFSDDDDMQDTWRRR